ncbi:hypothetical protein NDU88_000987 [Pleurodeles waltl]|uniref:Uncharacterized protein n=1 Tax=Pleurodeles waltl TaxID=8319 RepID=A0AAV7MIF5_PLEWA|nr:hypothetical protein NDU88_000987 [Pleurodeles waltl]
MDQQRGRWRIPGGLRRSRGEEKRDGTPPTLPPSEAARLRSPSRLQLPVVLAPVEKCSVPLCQASSARGEGASCVTAPGPEGHQEAPGGLHPTPGHHVSTRLRQR